MRGEIERSDNELGAACDDGAGVRFDPQVLYCDILSEDWRNNAQVNAVGLNHAAVRNGVVSFFDPVPNGNLSNFSGQSNGGKAPYAFTAVSMGLEILCPPTRSRAGADQLPSNLELAADPHAMIWAAIIARSLLSLRYAEIPIYDRIPVSQIGGRGGLWVSGGFQGGIGLAQEPSRRNGFPLPDELLLDPDKGSVIKAELMISDADLALLGDGVAPGPGWGAPMAQGQYLVEPIPGTFALQGVPYPKRGVRLVFFGRKGLNVTSGTGSLRRAAKMSGAS